MCQWLITMSQSSLIIASVVAHFLRPDIESLQVLVLPYLNSRAGDSVAVQLEQYLPHLSINPSYLSQVLIKHQHNVYLQHEFLESLFFKIRALISTMYISSETCHCRFSRRMLTTILKITQDVVSQWPSGQGVGLRSEMAGVRFSDAASHRMQIGQNAFVTSLPLPTQERARRDWVVGRRGTCVPVSQGRTLRAVWLLASHMCVKANAGIVCRAQL